MPPVSDSLSLTLRRCRRRLLAAALIDATNAALVTAACVTAVAMVFDLSPVAPALTAAAIAAFLAWRTPPSAAGAAAWLDHRHGLSDLLASAWAVRRQSDEPWAAALIALATRRAADLPPSDWPGRFTLRHHACGLAAAAVLLLSTRLIPPAVTSPAAVSEPRLAAGPSPTAAVRPRVAKVSRRAGESAESPMRAPFVSAADEMAAGPSSPRGTNPSGVDARGTGRADADSSSALPAAKGTRIMPTDPAASGSGRAVSNITDHRPGVGGVVTQSFETRADGPTALRTDTSNSASSARDSANAPPRTTATPPPAAYRELIVDYFAR